MYGLVLEGGGTRGAYHIGAYKALRERKFEIGAVTGTSIGALNGALIAQGSYDIAEELWSNLNYSMITNISDLEEEILTKEKLGIDDIKIIGARLKTLLEDRGMDIGPLKELIEETIDEDKLREAEMDFGMVTVNLSEFKNIEVFKDEIPYGELKDYLLASAYLPIFKTEKLKGSIYLDGAFHDNLPFNMLRNKGYGKIIFIRTYGSGKVRKLEVYDSDIMIAPREDLGGTLDCDSDRSIYNMKLGYYDTIKVLDGLKGDKYYIDENGSVDYFQILNAVEDEDVTRLEKILKVSQLTCKKRSLFELIIPKISSLLGLDKDHSYEDLLISLIELKAKNMKIERFKVYGFEELLDEIKKSENLMAKVENEGLFDKIMKKIDIPILNKENTLVQVFDIIFK